MLTTSAFSFMASGVFRTKFALVSFFSRKKMAQNALFVENKGFLSLVSTVRPKHTECALFWKDIPSK